MTLTVLFKKYMFVLFFKIQKIGKEIVDDPADVVVPAKKPAAPLSGFIMSKWETVDPEQVEAQAMTTSKWDLLGSSADPSQDGSSIENQDSNDYTDTR